MKNEYIKYGMIIRMKDGLLTDLYEPFDTLREQRYGKTKEPSNARTWLENNVRTGGTSCPCFLPPLNLATLKPLPALLLYSPDSRHLKWVTETPTSSMSLMLSIQECMGSTLLRLGDSERTWGSFFATFVSSFQQSILQEAGRPQPRCIDTL